MFQKLINNPIFAATVGGLVVTSLLSLFLVAKVVTEVINWTSNYDYPAKTITVNGEGKEVAVPNIATFNFSVVESGPTTEDAQNKATEKINKAIDMIKQNGVEEKDIKTEGYYAYPTYDYTVTCMAIGCPPSKPKISGYEVSQSVTVKVRKQDEAGKFLTELGKIGVSNISGISFTIEDENILKDKAKEKAINDAKVKAEILAQQLGVKLKGVVSFGEDQPYMDAGGYAPMMSESKASAPEIMVGENTYTSRVWVSYEIK